MIDTTTYFLALFTLTSIGIIAFKMDSIAKKKYLKRKLYIENLVFQKMITHRLKIHYPELNESQLEEIISGLKIFFLMVLNNKGKPIAMPSQCVDVAWHEFILCTKDYAIFCENAFGKFLHHTPTESMKSETEATEGILNSWKFACELENIDPEKPSRIPKIFAIDSKLNIKKGFHYILDCSNIGYGKYCVTHIANQYEESRRGSGGGGCSVSSGCGGD